MQSYDVIIIGGGASGFFTAINIAEQNPELSVAILERGKEVLSKVRISGGGRCNVTHACFIPNLLTKYYPRGEKELRGPFHTFSSGDMVAWLEQHGVDLKTEEDGRMFPETNSSQTIIDCFTQLAQELHIKVITSCSVQQIFQSEDLWKLDTSTGNFISSQLVVAAGSSPKIWNLMKESGHTIIPPVPSLFTFNCKDERIKNLMGVAANEVSVHIKDSKLKAEGPLLITHWGFSGPAILRLSAWGARELSEKTYRFQITVNWLHEEKTDDVLIMLQQIKNDQSKRLISKKAPIDLPNRLWEQLTIASGISSECKWADATKKQLITLAEQLTRCTFEINGKSTFKEEFVTAGGIDLKEINFKTMESKLLPQLYFTGEIINIDAITGGFNFQNAWTTGYLAAQAIANK